jgi:hypothetical protein
MRATARLAAPLPAAALGLSACGGSEGGGGLSSGFVTPDKVDDVPDVFPGLPDALTSGWGIS